ncbi:DUF4956 domain-containing protein [Spirochaeta africana]|uniref:DUF4956 domain-containing protein n=1 Tax=Spirochaeta africana (strain ATCC 700263 / DSM 8902 / Z-7692) TaxID=889378 RepID=H9UHZ4_SPIAZ|nr:DUF4956 domain-containing protein [Spirochaeta africana]AFG37137.1 hypothetical protein Spiaf_1050 [Spirochaeta africana DSM 8902]
MNRLIAVILVPPDQLMNFGISLLLAILLGLGIAAVYRYTHRGLNYESSFPATLVLLTPIVTLVMFFIQGDLVLSLGLVGSLSIIRFRTPIKDTRDMVFLFWTIAIGLGVGTHHWTYAVLATLFLALVVSVFYLTKYGRQLQSEYILIVGGAMPYNYQAIEHITGNTPAQVQLRSHEIDGENWELTYEFRFERKLEQRIQQLAGEVRQVEGVRKVSLLTPQLTLPM